MQLTMTLQVMIAPSYAGQSVSVIKNYRTLWCPATIVCAANYGSYIIKLIGGAEYRWAWDHICEHHPDAVKPDIHTKVEVAGQSITTPSASVADQLDELDHNVFGLFLQQCVFFSGPSQWNPIKSNKYLHSHTFIYSKWMLFNDSKYTYHIE